jgi:hypothetical protein
VYESLKKEGLLSDYKVWTNVTSDSPGDWDVAVGLMFANYAAIESSMPKRQLASPNITAPEMQCSEAAKKRNELRDVVASKLAREVMPK